MNLLFLLKKNYDYNYSYPEYTGLKNSTGLFNSANFIAKSLVTYLHETVNLEICVDGNDIDKYLFIHKPDICFLEAIWVTPEKLLELTLLYPNIKFVIRIHSNVPFLSAEGVAIEWLIKYNTIPNVSIAFNNLETTEDFNLCSIKGIYLPNIYFNTKLGYINESRFTKILNHISHIITSLFSNEVPKIINIGCFGAIRPMKNQLLQAMAAIAFADKHKSILYFHINSMRIEQNGEPILRNIIALFAGSKHTLVEHAWMEHRDFLNLIKKMDVGIQLSLSESFNIVTADFVIQRVPIVVSPDISWMPLISQTGPFKIDEIINTLELAFQYKKLFTKISFSSLVNYNTKATNVWKEFLQNN